MMMGIQLQPANLLFLAQIALVHMVSGHAAVLTRQLLSLADQSLASHILTHIPKQSRPSKRTKSRIKALVLLLKATEQAIS